MKVEKILLKKVINGDQNAFKTLYDEYSNYALRVAAAVTKNNSIAADVVQETFIRIFNNIHKFDVNRPFKPWFYRILLNECNRSISKKETTTYISDYIENHQEISEYDVHSFEEYELLYRAIEDLDEINRIPLILKYLNDFQDGEIAKILDLNVNTVKSRLYKGKEKLKKIMKSFKKEVN
ncbi:UNVERIFIED_CONTAM: RNA polymerase sigma-70 factor (ECF subfamily) [Acetivibrio alkalicellulosi]